MAGMYVEAKSVTLIALLFQIRSTLFITSGLILTGVIIGLIVYGRQWAENTLPLLYSLATHSRQRNGGRERRQSRRLQSSAVLELQDVHGNYLPESARMLDVSLRGACFNSSVVLKEGHKINARLHSSNEGVLQISARVVWAFRKAHTNLYGIEYSSVDPVHL